MKNNRWWAGKHCQSNVWCFHVMRHIQFFSFLHIFLLSSVSCCAVCLMCEGNIDEWEQNYETPLRWSYSMWKIIKAKATINIFVWCLCFITLILFHIHVTQRHLKNIWWMDYSSALLNLYNIQRWRHS